MKSYQKNKEKIVTKVFQDVFDKYDPPEKSYKDRLETVKKAKAAQASILERL